MLRGIDAMQETSNKSLDAILKVCVNPRSEADVKLRYGQTSMIFFTKSRKECEIKNEDRMTEMQ